MKIMMLLVGRYKVEGELDAEPAVVFSYIEPSPNSPRSKWDRAIKELQLVQQVDSVGVATGNMFSITIIIGRCRYFSCCYPSYRDPGTV